MNPRPDVFYSLSPLLARRTSSLSSRQPGKEKMSPENQKPQPGGPGGVTPLITAAFSKAFAWHSHCSGLLSETTQSSRQLDSIFQPGAAKNPGRQGQRQAPESSSSPSACIALRAGGASPAPAENSWEISPTPPKTNTFQFRFFASPEPKSQLFPLPALPLRHLRARRLQHFSCSSC